MKRLLIIMALWLSAAWLSHTWAYTVTTSVTPEGAGSVSSFEGVNYSGGEYVWLYAYAYSGFKFLGWYEDGSLLSTQEDYSFVMPARNVYLEARYEFDPEVPGNPTGSESGGNATLHTLRVCSVPAGGAWFNIISTEASEGSSVWITATNFTNFYFQRWENEEGEIVSDVANFSYVMPNHDVMLYCYSQYNPDAPANPDSGISDAVRDGELRVWPLPMHDTLNVEVSGDRIASVSLTALTGKRVLTASGPIATIDVSALPSGIYILTVTTPHSTHTKKLIKK